MPISPVPAWVVASWLYLTEVWSTPPAWLFLFFPVEYLLFAFQGFPLLLLPFLILTWSRALSHLGIGHVQDLPEGSRVRFNAIATPLRLIMIFCFILVVYHKDRCL